MATPASLFILDSSDRGSEFVFVSFPYVSEKSQHRDKAVPKWEGVFQASSLLWNNDVFVETFPWPSADGKRCPASSPTGSCGHPHLSPAEPKSPRPDAGKWSFLCNQGLVACAVNDPGPQHHQCLSIHRDYQQLGAAVSVRAGFWMRLRRGVQDHPQPEVAPSGRTPAGFYATPAASELQR